MKIRTIKEFEEYIFKNFDAYYSSIDEINTFEHYSVENDDEHDYSLLKTVIKVKGQKNLSNDYEEIFILLFSPNEFMYDSKTLGMMTKKLEKVWRFVEWTD